MEVMTLLKVQIGSGQSEAMYEDLWI